MTIFLFALAGFLMGVLGGMGMGGGSIFIPFLTIFLSMPQIMAQGYNLLIFLPMSLLAVFIHKKNKLLVFDKRLFLFVIPGVIFAIGSAFLSQLINSVILSKLFGVFLLLLSLWELYCLINK